MIGRTLAQKYKVSRLLGEGGMGAVYEAQHAATRRRVAVKVIRFQVEPKSDTARRFRREAITAAAVKSPHIVQILDAGTDPATNFPYIVMEYLVGEDLQKLVARVGPLHPDVVMRVAGHALTGLRRTHETGIVHRDIKPANLFLARVGSGEVSVKLLDFGIAKVLDRAKFDSHHTALTRADAFLGSPFFVSPEQVENSSDVDHRTDLWALGATLYFALCGRAPHQEAPDVVRALVALRASPPRPLREIAPWVSPNIARVVHDALVIDPSKRHPSAAAMLLLVRRLQRGDKLREEELVGLSAAQRQALLRATDPPPPGSQSPASLWSSPLPVIDDNTSDNTTDVMMVREAKRALEADKPVGAWTPVMPMSVPRAKHTATLLEGGRVLVVGGVEAGRSVELFDPVLLRWMIATPALGECVGHAAVVLADGHVLVAGGLSLKSSSAEARRVAELRGGAMLFDPGLARWEVTAPMRAGRTEHTATRLDDGSVLVAGGHGTSAELFVPHERDWAKAPRMHVERHGHAAALLSDGRVLVTGGGDATAELFDPRTSQWAPVAAMHFPRRGHTMTPLLDGTVLIAGGRSATAELFDPRTSTFSSANPMRSARSGHTAVRLPDGRVLVAGGRNDAGVEIVDAELFDPATSMWCCVPPMHRPRADHTATALSDGRVLITGGRDPSGVTADAELWSPHD